MAGFDSAKSRDQLALRIKETKRRPLSNSEARLMFVSMISGNHAAYNIPAAIRLRGRLNHAKLEDGFRAVIQRHGTLRTAYRLNQGTPVAMIGSTQEFQIVRKDLTDIQADARENALSENLLNDARYSFDFECPPLLRVCLYRLDQDEHVLSVVLHHLVSDGWSFRVLLNEIQDAYNRDNLELRLPDGNDTLGYAEFVLEQRRLLKAEGTRHSAFWRSYLEGVDGHLDFNTDLARSTARSGEGNFKRFSFGSDLSARLGDFCKKHRVSKFHALASTFSLLLNRLTQQDDLLVAVPVANRGLNEFEAMIGNFVNTIPFRMRVDRTVSFADLVMRTKENWLGTLRHQAFPYGSIIDALRENSATQPDIACRSCFTFQSTNLMEFELNGLSVTCLDGTPLTFNNLEIPTNTAKFDLSLTCEEQDDCVIGQFEYAVEVFSEQEIDSIQSQYVDLVRTLLGEPEGHIERAIASSLEKRTHIDLCTTSVSLTQDTTIRDRIIQRCVNKPGAPAIELHAGSVISYGEFLERAARLANRLLENNVKAGDLVAIRVGRSGWFQTTVLAAWMVGAAYVPFDPNQPNRYVFKTMQSHGIRVIVTDLEPSAPSEIHPIHPDTSAESAKLTLFADIAPRDCAYVLFTSGSTGIPKGVHISHGNLVGLVRAIEERYGLGSDSFRHLQTASSAFDVATEDILRSLVFGDTLVLAALDTILDSEALLDFVRYRRISFAEFVPSMLVPVAEAAIAKGLVLDSMRVLVTGAEAISLDQLSLIHRVLPRGARLINSYGITETTIDNFTYEYDPSDAVLPRTPIGRPLTHTTSFVVDPSGHILPKGIVGELCLAGDCVGGGYLNNAEETAKRFRAVSATEPTLGTAFRTGDKARVRLDGRYEFLGRLDDQTKRNGVRIELAAIEAFLLRHPKVDNAIAVSQMRNGRTFIAAFVSGSLPEGSSGELLAWIRRHLPVSQCPDVIEILDKIPLTITGKPDREKLRRLEPQLLDSAREKTPKEAELSILWSEVLGSDQIRYDDDFFALGGHSLLLGKLAARISEVMGVSISIHDLFMSTRLHEQASLIENAEHKLRRPLVARERRFESMKIDHRGNIVKSE